MHRITKAFSPDGMRVIPAGEYHQLTDAEVAAAKRLKALGGNEPEPGATNRAERLPASRARAAKRETKGR